MSASNENNWPAFYASLTDPAKSPVDRVEACISELLFARSDYLQWNKAQSLSGLLMTWATREASGEEGYAGYLAAMSQPDIRRILEQRSRGHNNNVADNLRMVIRCLDGETIEVPTWKPSNPFYELAARPGFKAPEEAAEKARLLYDALTLAIKEVSPGFDSPYRISSAFSEEQLLVHLRSCVDPDLEKRPLYGRNGMVGVGQFAASIDDIYDVMTAWHPVVRVDDKVTETSWRGVFATLMGAEEFAHLEKAHTVESLCSQIKQQFAWVDEWYGKPGHLDDAKKEMEQFGEKHPKYADAKDNAMVWDRMRGIADKVKVATLEAVNAGVLGKQAIARLSELAGHFYNADFGGDDQGRDWAPRWTATLKAVSNVAEKAHRLSPTPASQELVTVVRGAMADHEEAKKLPSREKPAAPIITPNVLQVFGPRYAATVPVSHFQIAAA